MENLSEIRTGDRVKIEAIPGSCPLRIPLQQFGITPGSKLFCRYCSPGSELAALECEGTVLALRLSELSKITVVPCL